jgi:hypothetical protein
MIIGLFWSLFLQSRSETIQSSSDEGPNKYALIIANGNYEESTRWPDLSSLQDVPILMEALIKKGFDESDIYVVRDANHLQIDSAFISFANLVSADASVYVHYSGHGQQIYDDNGDEVDGYDEAIVPVNAPLMYTRGIYEGEYHIRDEQLGAYLDKIREATGPEGDAIFVVDACHSGTGTRGFTRHRGTSRALQPDGYTPKNQRDGQYGFRNVNENLAPLTCFYAASPNELNQEYQIAPGEYIGSLSLAVSKAISDAGPQTTYRSLFDKINLTMSVIAPSQTPMSEGLTDRVILGGELLEPVNYLAVKKGSAKDGVVYATCEGGQLACVFEGSKIAFYPIGTYDLSKTTPLVTGSVVVSNLLTSDVELDTPVDPNALEALWAVVTEKNYGNLTLRVLVDSKNEVFEEALKFKLSQYELIELSEEAPELIVENIPKTENPTRGVSKKDFQVYSSNDEVLWQKEIPDDQLEAATDEIVEVLINYSQNRFLRKLELTNNSLRATLKLEPLRGNYVGTSFVPDSVLSIESKRDASGNIVFKEGDHFRMRIKNEGTKTLYFTLLDIMPNNELEVLIPYEHRAAADFSLEPGYDYVSEPFTLSEPYGTEVFKLIATLRPLNLKEIVSTRGASSDPPKGPLDMLISDSFKTNKTQTRGATANLPVGVANIESFVFQIQP